MSQKIIYCNVGIKHVISLQGSTDVHSNSTALRLIWETCRDMMNRQSKDAIYEIRNMGAKIPIRLWQCRGKKPPFCLTCH